MATGADDMVNYGIIGCGMMAREHIANINLLPHGRVMVVYEIDIIHIGGSTGSFTR